MNDFAFTQFTTSRISEWAIFQRSGTKSGEASMLQIFSLSKRALLSQKGITFAQKPPSGQEVCIARKFWLSFWRQTLPTVLSNFHQKRIWFDTSGSQFFIISLWTVTELRTTMEIVSVIFVTAVFLSSREVRGDDTISRCTANELSQFSVEYETCHQRALQKIKVDNQIIK